MGFAHRLAEWVEGTSFDQLPPRVVDASKEMMVNAAAVALAGAAQPDGLAVTKFAQEMRGNGKCTIIGMGLRSSPVYSCLANGTMVRMLDFDDELADSAAHPSCVVFPVVMALGEMHGFSGADVLNAFALGCEVLCKLSGSGEARVDGAMGGISAGPVAAAAAAGRLLGLGNDQLGAAIASAMKGPRIDEPGAVSLARAVQSGQAAMNGVAAALLAQEDFGRVGLGIESPNSAGRDESGGFFASLDASHSLVDPGVVLKPFACNTASHATVDAVLQLAQQYRIDAADVDSVRVEAPASAVDALAFPNPRDGWEARESLHYVVAASLLYGHPLIEQFSDLAVQEPDVLALMDRITVAPSLEPLAFAPQASEVSVVLRGGRTLQHRVEFPRGHPEMPLERQELDAKFLYCSRYILPPDHIEGALEQFWDLENVADVTGLASILGG